MRVRPVLSALLLALSVAVGSVPGGTPAAEPSDAVRDPVDAFVFDFGNTALVPGSQTERDRQYRSMLNGEIDALKGQLTQLHLRAQVARDQLQGSEHVCERRQMTRHYASEKARLRGQIAAIRGLRGGDARKFFTRLSYQVSRAAKSAWYRVGPFGRKILRELGDEAYRIVNSGGTLQGGAARRLILAIGRKHTPELLVRALTRKARQADARALAAAAKACDQEKGSPAPSSSPDTIGRLATPVPSGVCAGNGVLAVLPPYEEDAILVVVDWEPHHDDAFLQYVVTTSDDPLSSPFSGASAGVTAGCAASAVICGERAPLILTDAPVSGPNAVWSQDKGVYTIVATTGGACAYKDAANEYHWAPTPSELSVGVTLDYYRAGDPTPCASVPLERTSVPALEAVPMDATSLRRILGSVTWTGSVAEVCGS